jgi:cell division protein FtsL
MRERNTESSGFWLVWPIILLAIFVAVIFAYSISKETKKKKQVETEINLLKEQAEKIAKENMTLQERIRYLGSEDYQKIQAKDKLGLQSPGENVVVISPGPEKKED